MMNIRRYSEQLSSGSPRAHVVSTALDDPPPGACSGGPRGCADDPGVPVRERRRHRAREGREHVVCPPERQRRREGLGYGHDHRVRDTDGKRSSWRHRGGSRREPVVHGGRSRQDRADHHVRHGHGVPVDHEQRAGLHRGGTDGDPVVHPGRLAYRANHDVRHGHGVPRSRRQLAGGITAGPDGNLWFTENEPTRSGGSLRPVRSPSSHRITSTSLRWTSPRDPMATCGSRSSPRIRSGGSPRRARSPSSRFRRRPNGRSTSPPALMADCGSRRTASNAIRWRERSVG